MWGSRLRGLSVHAKWLIAVVVVASLLGGSATAALQITGKNVRNSSLTGVDIRDSSLTGADVKDRSLTARDFRGSIRGPEGPIGPQGARGPTGLSLVVPVDGDPVSLPGDGSPEIVEASCGPGYVVVSGGFTPAPSPISIPIVLSSEATIQPDGNFGWTLIAYNESGTSGNLTATANCAPLPPDLAAASAAKRLPRGAALAHPQIAAAWHDEVAARHTLLRTLRALRRHKAGRLVVSRQR